MFLKQSTSQVIRFGPCLDKTNGVSEETTLTLAQADMRLSKDGGAFAQKSAAGNATHDSDGWYSTTLSTTDTATVGELILNVHQPANMLPVWMRFYVVEEAIYDALFAASSAAFDANQRVDVGEWLGTAVATPTVAGVPEVDLTHMGGVTQSAADLKDFADAGYDPGTNKVQGVVLVDTTTTNTDMRGTDSAALASVCTEARLAELDGANIPADIDAIPTTPMRGTDSAALASVCTEGRLAELDAANLPTDVAAIPTTAMRGTDSAALASVCTEARLAELAAANLPSDVDDIMGATFSSATDSLEAIRNRGDAAWITGGGGGITDILNIVALIPNSIDLANTATWRLGLMLINSLDDLPSTGEITPGTISIDRKAAAETSWSNVVNDAACSEAAGLVYYDEVFDAGSGYVVGDSIRVTFKAQKIIVAANDYEISDATGRVFYTQIRESMRGTDSAALASVCTEGRLAELDGANIPADIDAIPTTPMRGTDSAALASVCTEARLAELDGANMPADIDAIPTTAMRGTDSAALASVCTEARLAELDGANLPTDVAAIPTTAMRGTDNAALASVCTEARLAELAAANLPADVDTIDGKLPAALVGGKMSSDAVAISGSTDAADKLEASAETIVVGAAEAGTLSTTQMTSDLAEATDDHYNGRIIIWTSGVLQNQASDITDYSGATGLLTFTAVTEAPSAADTFVIV